MPDYFGKCNCLHATPFLNNCCFCNIVTPSSLFEICINFLSNNIHLICQVNRSNMTLNEGIVLPVNISERLLIEQQNGLLLLNNYFCSLFRNTKTTKLKNILIRNTTMTDVGFRELMRHKPTHLDISYTNELSTACLYYISIYGHYLESLSFGDGVDFVLAELDLCFHTNFVIRAPRLRKLTIKSVQCLGDPSYIKVFLKPFTKLTHLDLSNSEQIEAFDFLSTMPLLTSLTLFNVKGIDRAAPYIILLKYLKHLDVSQAEDAMTIYEHPNELLATFVENLPELTSLDISCTNLAGTGVAEHGVTTDDNKNLCRTTDIPGLISRVDNPLEFLGLFYTLHSASRRFDIPAHIISGDGDEHQLLVAASVYKDRYQYVKLILQELYFLVRHNSCKGFGVVIEFMLHCINKFFCHQEVHIICSATIFYIMKVKQRFHLHVCLKRRIITTLLNVVHKNPDNKVVVRNVLLTLCEFEFPEDVLFEFQKMIRVIKNCIIRLGRSEFLVRLSLFLLNSLACLTNTHYRIIMGNYDIVTILVQIVFDHLVRVICDDILEVTWLTLWNITDQTPVNCERFINLFGLDYLVQCLTCFSDNPSMKRNMIGVLDNISEVTSLHPYLMTQENMRIFFDLLSSTDDGIEVSYHSAGIICQLLTNELNGWPFPSPTRDEVIEKLINTIDGWNVYIDRNIHYYSLEPLYNIASNYEHVECQYWAIWGLTNLTMVYPEIYCDTITAEGGVILMKKILKHDAPLTKSKDLAALVIENCEEGVSRINLQN